MRRLVIALAVAVVVLAAAFQLGLLVLVKAYRVPSSSMEPTVRCAEPLDGCSGGFSDRVAAVRYGTGIDPDRGDIVALRTPPQAVARCGAGGTFIKRIVVLPGETWEVRDGVVFVDGKRLEEPYVRAERRDPETSRPPQKVPPGSYVALGDNRAASCDSRVWGPVPRENLVAEVFLIYWPPGRFQLM